MLGLEMLLQDFSRGAASQWGWSRPFRPAQKAFKYESLS